MRAVLEAVLEHESVFLGGPQSTIALLWAACQMGSREHFNTVSRQVALEEIRAALPQRRQRSSAVPEPVQSDGGPVGSQSLPLATAV